MGVKACACDVARMKLLYNEELRGLGLDYLGSWFSAKTNWAIKYALYGSMASREWELAVKSCRQGRI